MASDLKSVLVMTAFQRRPHVKLMGNLAVGFHSIRLCKELHVCPQIPSGSTPLVVLSLKTFANHFHYDTRVMTNSENMRV